MAAKKKKSPTKGASGKALVIVESPAKAKTINKYLGSDYIVRSSVGHICDLPTKGGGKSPPGKKGVKLTPEEKAAKKHAALVRRMGIDPDNDWEANYSVLPGKEKVLEELQKIAETASDIYLATDLDREGEAIAWHLQEEIGGDPSRYKRVTFAEITKQAIQDAFANPSQLDMNRVNAQQARRFLDRVVGFMVSPLLWQKVARGLSAGRVQSVATRLVVEREQDIRAFIPDEFWEIQADFKAATKLVADLVKVDGKRLLTGADVAGGAGKDQTILSSDAEATRVADAIEAASCTVQDIQTKSRSQRPNPPFITSTLQQAAANALGFAVKKTMTLAQRLYEAGYITYMRTDSTNLSNDAISAVRTLIEKDFGADYIPEKPNFYGKHDDNAQEAHEAIRPSDVRLQPKSLKSVEPDQIKLYNLIRNRFIACQMPPAKFDNTTVTISAGDHQLRARGRILIFDGYQKVLGFDSEDRILPTVEVGQVLPLESLHKERNFTKPPARYNEASLVRELEKKGIGRPSTYASVISTIQERGYVRVDRRRMFAQKIGDIVTERLVECFPHLLNYDFTKGLEESLDAIAQGNSFWIDELNKFYDDFTDALKRAEDSDTTSGGMRPNDPTPTPISCPECDREMQIRTGQTGVFLGCSGYGLPKKEKCTKTLPLTPGEEVVEIGGDEAQAELQELQNKRRCKKCNRTMDAYLVDEGRKLHVCGDNPDCDICEIETGTFKIKGYDGPILECDKCEAEMQLKNGRFGKYFGCTSDTCKNTRKLLRNGEPAPPKADPIPMPELPCEKSDGHFVLRDGAAGIFLASSNYPRSRETRNPKIKEILPHADELDPKYAHLAKAPAEDKKGRPAIVRFRRKEKVHYVMSEDDGKPSGWEANWTDGEWVVTEKKKAAKKKKKSAKKGTAKKVKRKS
ncbi:MAG: DNA topoisomerase I subunit omega [Planctomycetaceae bacterium]|nr:DNA topoisomerase I subunit omega [Planctomycetaceae bacterium]|tara:strand:- start:874 stop:3618 length:2745 start_codon:yes stop_codon:yes gene_type:complete